jgi:hypothetical protein
VRAADLDVLATQLTAALDGPLLLYLSSAILTQTGSRVSERLSQGWEDLVRQSAERWDPGFLGRHEALSLLSVLRSGAAVTGASH